MHLKDLVSAVSLETGLTKANAAAACHAVFNAMGETLAVGERVTIAGFGTLEVRERASRPGRNPHTGEPVVIPASKNVGFKAAKALKEKL